ncbi:LysR substrate-binding domain-containing protein [uncultured Herbaspirillum sp.]|uniref:LysR substrate-binding domain-containing protein n=1 Tax=uncultured Herbaspirillum sp. TaxID=160236 RepID=UPI00258979B2|nr:LysR substrate-binding domain-containing protein [uncultured Herbaspirillum sp.]
MRISPLPPLPSLIAFEAAMRHGSFTRAAAELHLTQSAISRQIAQLERFLGKKLFLREPRALRLTVSGQRYAALVQRLLVDCAEATEDVMKRKGHQELTVACSQGGAVLWLTPRLARFRAQYPDCHLRLIVNDSLAQLSETDFDMGIYFLRDGPPSGLAARRLYDEEVFPVCSPAYLGGRSLSPAELRHETLLMLEDGQRNVVNRIIEKLTQIKTASETMAARAESHLTRTKTCHKGNYTALHIPSINAIIPLRLCYCTKY